MSQRMTPEQQRAHKKEVEAEAVRMKQVVFDLCRDYNFFDPWKALEALNEIENVSKDTIRDVRDLAERNGIDVDHLTLFLYMAKRRRAIKYDKIETWQDQVNELSELKEMFTAPRIGEPNPIKQIKLKLRTGHSVELSNDDLLFNFYIQIHPALNHFLNGYIQQNYRKVVKRQRASKGRDKSNKKLAHNFIKYLQLVSPRLANNKTGEIVLEIFEFADNKLPYETGKKCYEMLRPKK